MDINENSPLNSWLRYDVPMSTGRRIALEIRESVDDRELAQHLDELQKLAIILTKRWKKGSQIDFKNSNNLCVCQFSQFLNYI